MTETIAPPKSPAPPAEPSRRGFFKRAALVTAVAGLAAGIGLKAWAHDGPGGWHRGGFMDGPVDPAMVDARLDRMLKHIYIEIDATDAQKQQLGPILKSAAHDLLPLRDRIRDGRLQALALLSQPTVDRAALEGLRTLQLQLADQASKRLTQAVADAADVLTPEQRKQLADRIGRWQRHRG